MTPSPLLAALAALLAAAPPEAAPAPNVLRLEDALRIAQEAQPSVRQARAQIEAAQARVTQARSGLFPQVNATLGYQVSTKNYLSRPGSLPSSINQTSNSSFNLGNYLSGAVTASQLVWDFGQTTGRWRAAQRNAEAQESGEKGSRLQAALAVRTAYLDARGARALFEVAEQAVAASQRHVAQAQGFFDLGAKPKIDVVQAQSELANSQLQRIQAANAYRTAKAQLSSAMGREGPGDFEVGDDTLPPVEGEALPFASLLDEAVRARPEIAQFELEIRAQQELLRSNEGTYWPTVGVQTGFTGGGQDFTALGWNWSAQATVSWPIFEGYRSDGAVAEAKALVAALQAQRDGLRQQVALELEQARLAVDAGKQALMTATEAMTLARDRLELSEGRYRTGAGSIIELEDAQTAFTNAAGQRVKSEFDLAVARANLLKALGRP